QRRQVVLHPAGGRSTGRDRPPSRTPPVFPRRPPARKCQVRSCPLRRHEGHEPRVSSCVNRRCRAARKSYRKGSRCRTEKPVRRLRNLLTRKPTAKQQEAKPFKRLHRGGQPATRSG